MKNQIFWLGLVIGFLIGGAVVHFAAPSDNYSLHVVTNQTFARINTRTGEISLLDITQKDGWFTPHAVSKK